MKDKELKKIQDLKKNENENINNVLKKMRMKIRIEFQKIIII